MITRLKYGPLEKATKLLFCPPHESERGPFGGDRDVFYIDFSKNLDAPSSALRGHRPGS